MEKVFTLTLCWLIAATYSFSQVRSNYEYNTTMPYGTLDIRTHISSSDFYYLQEDKTFSFRESSPGVRTDTYHDMTSDWDSSPYKQGNLRRKTGTLDKFVMNYRLLLPAAYSSSYADGYPMVVHFHGAVERGNCYYENCYHATPDYTVEENSPAAPKTSTHRLLNNDNNLNVGGKQYLAARDLAGTRQPNDPSMPSRAFPGFVLSAQMFNIWDSLQVEDVIRIVRLVADQYNIDEDRIYVQGLSIGGYSVYESMKRASWLFAAALPMSAVWDANIFTQNQQSKVAHIPLWVFQGGTDPRPSPAFTENIIRQYEDAGGIVRYTKYSGSGHVIWNYAYSTADYFSWMLKQSKANLHAFAGNTIIDKSKGTYPKLMLAEGFLAYQWEKDGAILGNTANTLTVTAPGRYRARYSRNSSSPSEAQWNRWSQYITITDNGSSTPTVSVTITNPDEGQSFTAPASITISAMASVSEGTIAKVEFYNGTTKLGEDATSPYSYSWTNVSAGNYSLRAQAIDGGGNSAISSVAITVKEPINTSPTVNITNPDPGQSFTAPASISITATASDSDGSITKVEFFNGTTKLDEDTSSPYSYTWSNVSAGSYTLHAKAIDNSGGSATSSVSITVAPAANASPTVTITNPDDGQSFTAPASISITATASDTDGSIAKVEFYNGTTKLGEDASSPYSYTWSNVDPGNYTLSAKAIDNSGGSATKSVSVTVAPPANVQPSVTITSPDNGQTFTAPASISITASASDSDGNIAKVEFYNGTSKLGEDATSPYSYTWNNVSAGTYALTAKAIDNSSGAATSRVDVTVTAASEESCPLTGGIQAEIWTGVSGTSISSIPLNSSPSSVKDLSLFETPSNIGDNYGSRVRGYLCVPITGSYTFWIASDDVSELWLSTDDNPANKTKIAYVSSWTGLRQWDKYAAQKSGARNLVAGSTYYIEALLKEASGGDHVSVGWQLPGGALERPIPGNRLIKFQNSTNTPPTVNITNPDDGQSFTAPASVTLTATASDGDGSITKVEFFNGSAKLGEDTTSPYSFTWSSVSAGTYSLTAKAIDDSGNSATDVVSITVNPESTGEGCASTGAIQAEVWTGISGTRISSIPLTSAPSSVTDLTIFETPVNIGDNYGSRVRGYLCVPTTGSYTFWIASDDVSELWLSSDEGPANTSRIAYVSGWTSRRQWDKYATQQSASINLLGGGKYYVEALLKEGTGGDHLAVGWQLPGGALERPIPASRLIKFQSAANNSPAISITSPDDAQSFTAPASVTIGANASDSDGSVSKVEFYNGSTKLGEDATSPYSFTWNNVTEGSYSLTAKAIDNSGNSATDIVSITVTGGSSGEGCAATGGIQVETWTGISGTRVSSIPIDTPPTSVADLTIFETPVNIGDNYGSRVRGYICVPASGNYTFWVASDDMSELWLSTDDNPANKRQIAYVSGWTSRRQYDKYTSQASSSISLTGGRQYYIEALLKEGTGGDHLSVGWQLPDGSLERPIGGNRLIPYGSGSSTERGPGLSNGTIESEVWTGISGLNVSSIPVDSPPDEISELTNFETERNIGDNYGSRVRGYVNAPATGGYTFWIASDDRSELWLSSDENPANKSRIAYVAEWTHPRQWDKYSSQKSAAVQLVSGRKYYIEALLKEGTGGDHLAVGWKLPNGQLEMPIPGARLSPFADSETMARQQTETTKDKTLYSQINIYPNPLEGGNTRLTIGGYRGITETIETQVDIINMTGDIVFTGKIHCGGDCSDYLLNINKQLVPGVYLMTLKSNGVRNTQRLFVK